MFPLPRIAHGYHSPVKMQELFFKNGRMYPGLKNTGKNPDSSPHICSKYGSMISDISATIIT